jgi:hypothetical protein
MVVMKLRVEIVGRDKFWEKAVWVEWAHQFPGREVVHESGPFYLIEPEWLADMERVARECQSRAVVAPANVGRRLWFRRLLPGGGRQ